MNISYWNNALLTHMSVIVDFITINDTVNESRPFDANKKTPYILISKVPYERNETAGARYCHSRLIHLSDTLVVVKSKDIFLEHKQVFVTHSVFGGAFGAALGQDAIWWKKDEEVNILRDGTRERGAYTFHKGKSVFILVHWYCYSRFLTYSRRFVF